MEKPNEPTPEEIGEVILQLRRLSPDISINPFVKSAIRSFWHNVPAGLARVKSAIAQGWCKQPTGLFVQALKVSTSGDGEAVVVNKEYPQPTLEQLNQLGELGSWFTQNKGESGYPLVVARWHCVWCVDESGWCWGWKLREVYVGRFLLPFVVSAWKSTHVLVTSWSQFETCGYEQRLVARSLLQKNKL